MASNGGSWERGVGIGDHGIFLSRKKSRGKVPGSENSSPVLSSIVATSHMSLLITQSVAIIECDSIKKECKISH